VSPTARAARLCRRSYAHPPVVWLPARYAALTLRQRWLVSEGWR
jgi:hypothetical protein